jgi:CheY-like chemotaxis protein
MNKIAESNSLLKVLCLEDVLKDAELLNEMLVDADYRVSMDVATGQREYVDFLKSRNYDIIFADNSLPGMDAFLALKLAHSLKPEIPFICISGTIGEEKAVELLKQGASDYVLKDRLGRIALAAQRALKEKDMQKKRRQAEDELRIKIDELIISNKELAFQIREKGKREDELIILNSILDYQNKERGKRADELIIANKELTFQNKEKEKRADELIIANKELIFQNEEKGKRANELIKAKENAEESDRLKSAFIKNMNREIRTPMNGILGFAKLLEEADLSSEEKQDYIKTIRLNGERMLSTINSIIEFK